MKKEPKAQQTQQAAQVRAAIPQQIRSAVSEFPRDAGARIGMCFKLALENWNIGALENGYLRMKFKQDVFSLYELALEVEREIGGGGEAASSPQAQDRADYLAEMARVRQQEGAM